MNSEIQMIIFILISPFILSLFIILTYYFILRYAPKDLLQETLKKVDSIDNSFYSIIERIIRRCALSKRPGNKYKKIYKEYLKWYHRMPIVNKTDKEQGDK